MTHPNALDLRAMIAASEGICDDLEAEGYSGAIIRRTLRALIKERDEAAERIEELQAACEVVSSEFEGELWVVCRRILKKTDFDFQSDDGVQAAVFEEHINEVLADLKSRAEVAESELAGLKDAYTGAMEDKRMWKRRAEAAEAKLEELEDKIENAAQAMSETQPSWEYRCHAIMAALGCDYGGPTPDIPEEHTWYALNLARHKVAAEAADARVKELERLCEVMSKFIAGDSTQRGVQAAYEFRKALNPKGTTDAE